MLYTIAVVLIVLGRLGLLTSTLMGDWFRALLVLAVVRALVSVCYGRGGADRRKTTLKRLLCTDC